MKKALSLLLAIAMVLSLMPMAAFAATPPTFYFETDFSTDLGVGDTFTVTCKLKDNIDYFSGVTLSVDWNENAVAFTGFQKNGRVLASEVFDVSQGYQAPVINWDLGIIVTNDLQGYDLEGVVFTANFEIVAESGELGIGLKNGDRTEFELLDMDGNVTEAVIDTSALNGLTVGGKPVGPAMPEDAPFTAITTDVGPIVAIEEADWVNGVPHYIVTIPADAETAYVTAPDQLVMEDYMTGELQATAYASDLSFSGELLYISYNYEDTADGPKVEIPMEMTATDWSNNEVKLSFFSNDEYNPATHAFGIEDASNACLGWISFVYDDGAESYDIHIDDSIVGGSIWAENLDGDEITKAKEGTEVWLGYEANSGYKMKTIGYFYEGQFYHVENGAIVMPAGEITLTATFEKLHAHVYDKEVAADKYLKDAATCQSGAVYYKSCECGEFVTTADTFVSGESVTHHYVDGKCQWCQLAEVIGYRFATSADVSAENGGTAVVHVKITGHSDPNVKNYNAYDLTLTFDSDKLEYQGYDGAVKSDNGSVTVEGNTIRIVGCGANKGFGTEIAALTFKTKAEGNANVTISKVQVSDKDTAVDDNIPEATPKHDEDDTGADETPDVSVIVVPYSVTKPDFISGNDKVLHGAAYTFSYTDTTNYTYADLTVTVGGTEVTPTEENGVYTIAGVTGAIKITATQTPNSYDVSKPENVTGPDEATYGEDYIFTVTPYEGYEIDEVKATIGDKNVDVTLNAEGKYVIDGENITGSITITVTQKEIVVPETKYTNITFSGITVEEIVGGLTQKPEAGKDFTFTLNTVEGYNYVVKIGDDILPANEDGTYTIPAAQMIEGNLAVTIVKTEIINVEVAEYVQLNGKSIWLVTAKSAVADSQSVLKYGESVMYTSNKYGTYSWLVISSDSVEAVKTAAEVAVTIAETGTNAPTVAYDCDVNGTSKVDVNDAQLVYDMYNAAYEEFTDKLTVEKFLEADMETDGKLDTKDVAAIISYIVSGANA